MVHRIATRSYRNPAILAFSLTKSVPLFVCLLALPKQRHVVLKARSQTRSSRSFKRSKRKNARRGNRFMSFAGTPLGQGRRLDHHTFHGKPTSSGSQNYIKPPSSYSYGLAPFSSLFFGLLWLKNDYLLCLCLCLYGYTTK